MTDNRFLKRLRKKAKKGLRGWPLATIAFYGPNLSQATKAAVGIIPSENAEADEMRAWHVLHGDIREDVSISQEIVEFIQDHGALSVIMTNDIIGCPHQAGVLDPRRYSHTGQAMARNLVALIIPCHRLAVRLAVFHARRFGRQDPDARAGDAAADQDLSVLGLSAPLGW